MNDDAYPADGPELETVMETSKGTTPQEPSLRRVAPERLPDEPVGGGHLEGRPDLSVAVFLLDLLGPVTVPGQAE